MKEGTALSAPPAEAVFRRVRRVPPESIDALGHVNNLAWVGFVVDLASDHSTAVGLDFEAYRRLGGFWIVRRHEIDYHRAALPSDQLLEETWISEQRGARSVRHARFRRAQGGELFVAARTEWAFVDATTQRPRRIPEAVTSRFVVLAEPPPIE
jgi:acyl-CoA thioester hydrolase